MTDAAIRGWTIGCALWLAACALPALAQKQRFDFSLEAALGYTDNIRLSGDGGQDGNTDTFGQFSLDLPYERETQRSDLSFRYRPSIFRYQDFEQLDRDEHRADFGWTFEPGRRSDLSVRASYGLTQQQGTPESAEDPDLNLTPRADRELTRLNVRFSHEASRRWAWDLGLRGQALNYKAVPGFNPTGFEFQDRTDFGPRIQGRRKLSETSYLGVRYEYRRFDLESTATAAGGEQDSNQLAVTYQKDLGRRLELEAAVGGYRNSVDAGAAMGTDSGVLAELFVTRRYERFRSRLFVWHRPSAGGSFRGTSIDSTVGLRLSSTGGRERPWIWSVSPRVSRRDPDDPARATVDSYGVRGEIERRVSYVLGVRVFADYFDQDTNDSVFRASVGIRWYPVGSTRLGARGG